MTIRRHVGCLCLAALAAGSAQAGDINFSGFGSFIAGMKDHNTPTSYAGYDTFDLTFDPDSLAGLQATTSFNDKFSATIQVVARASNEWNAEMDWAYLRYQATDELAFRFGRVRVPFYLYSDFISVGYAYPWITPPFEVYNIAFSNMNGADVVWQHALGSVDLMVQAYAGSAAFTVKPPNPLAGADGETRNQVGLITELTWQAFKFRYAYHRASVYIDSDLLTPTVNALRTAGQNDTADRFEVDRDMLDFQDLAIQYDDGDLFVVAESIILSAHDDAPQPVNQGTLVTVGYHFGTVMPMITWGQRADDDPDLLQDTTIPQNSPTYLGLKAFQDSLAQDNEQWTLGVRWDFTDAMAFKAEITQFNDNNDSDNDAVLTRAGIQVVF